MNIVVTISVVIGIVTYTVFLAFCLINWRRGVTGLALLLAGVLTLLWLVSPLFAMTRQIYLVGEPVVIAAWIILLERAMGLSFELNQSAPMRLVIWVFLTALAMAMVATVLSLAATLELLTYDLALFFHLAMVLINVLGLVLVEQLSQNSVSDLRWRIRYLNIGLGMMFVFGLVHHALTVVLGAPVVIFSALQPAVMALVVPFVVIASLRNRTNRLRFNLSRSFVFRTGILVSTGTLLLLLGMFGYLAQIFAGDIGITVAVFVGIIGIAFTLTVVGSSQFRSRLRVTLSKTFFEYRYDYRDEWLKVTVQLTEPDVDFDLSQQAQRAMLSILHAKRSCLWIKSGEHTYVPVSHIEAEDWFEPIPESVAHAITEFYAQCNWVLDLKEMPELAVHLGRELKFVARNDSANYLIPLFLETELFGICLIGPSEISMSLSWEDYDILKLISKQCAGFLALQDANQLLIEHEQLSAVNQMSAFLLHDIKTIMAQLSLMLDNAPQHRNNPAFIDDMLDTTKNSVQRMQRIITTLRDPQETQRAGIVDVDLGELLLQRQAQSTVTKQRIEYVAVVGTTVARVNREALATALTHLEQNALQAIDEAGSVRISLTQSDHWALIQVMDDGAGMTAAFIKNDLFTPFRSSKGLAGMGIGAYQARSMVRSCGGDLQVESKVGVGTTFTIRLALAKVEI